jgi:hydrogenase maturation factor
MVTGTVATVPDTAKDTVAALEGAVVPVACRLWKTECTPALAVTYVGAVLWEVA